MKVFVTVLWACAFLAHGVLGAGESCDLKGQWGDNACSLGGSLQVKSVPKNSLVTSQKCDSFYNKSEFEKQPVVSLPDAKSGESYVVVMVDPDAPRHPKGKYFLHWILSDIPGDDLKKGDLKNSKTIMSYKGPSPPEGTGTHRYMFLVFRQPAGSPVKELPISQRPMFGLGEWLASCKLCGPISGVQFRTNFSGNV